MSNQVILWGMLVFPWLTLFLMKQEVIKRFMPITLFTVVTHAIIFESGITLGLWSTKETIFPFNQTLPFVYGAIPAFTMWIFRFTYGRFWIYMVTNAIIDYGLAYIILPWLVARGIGTLSGSSLVLGITIIHAILLYIYQMWQEGIFIHYTEKKRNFSPRLQPAVLKPVPNDNKDKNDE